MKNVFDNYKEMLGEALNSVPEHLLEILEQSIVKAITKDESIYICGNGGSAAIAEHWTADFVKGVAIDTDLKPHIISLVSNKALMTAISNDIGYDYVFSKQLDFMFHDDRSRGILIVISSSGNSENIIQALKTANGMLMTTVALVGFDGGRIVKNNMADVIIHVESDNYGVVEDSHSVIMHVLAQYLRSQYANHTNPIKL